MTGQDITRAEVNREITKYRGMTRDELPEKYRNPENERDFNIAIALYLASDEAPKGSGSGPTYDKNDVLTGFRGIGIKKR